MLSHGVKGIWNKYAHVKFMTQYFVAFKTIYKCFFTPNTREQAQNKMITTCINNTDEKIVKLSLSWFLKKQCTQTM